MHCGGCFQFQAPLFCLRDKSLCSQVSLKGIGVAPYFAPISQAHSFSGCGEDPEYRIHGDRYILSACVLTKPVRQAVGIGMADAWLSHAYTFEILGYLTNTLSRACAPIAVKSYKLQISDLELEPKL